MVVIDSKNVILKKDGIIFLWNLPSLKKEALTVDSIQKFESKIHKKFQNLDLIFFELNEDKKILTK